MGLTFKENCPDLRNTRVLDVVAELRDYGISVDVHDPWVSPVEAFREYGIDIVEKPGFGTYDVILLAVAHAEFIETGVSGIRAYGRRTHILYDLKSIFPVTATDLRL